MTQEKKFDWCTTGNAFQQVPKSKIYRLISRYKKTRAYDVLVETGENWAKNLHHGRAIFIFFLESCLEGKISGHTEGKSRKKFDHHWMRNEWKSLFSPICFLVNWQHMTSPQALWARWSKKVKNGPRVGLFLVWPENSEFISREKFSHGLLRKNIDQIFKNFLMFSLKIFSFLYESPRAQLKHKWY